MKSVLVALSLATASILAPMTSSAMGSPENPGSVRIFSKPDCKLAVASARSARVMLTGLLQGSNNFDKLTVHALEYDAQILTDNIPDYCPNDIKTAISFADKLSTAVLKLDPNLEDKAVHDIFSQTVSTVNALQGPNRMQD